MPTEKLRLKRFVATSSFAGAAVLLAAGSTAWACIGGGMASPFIDSPAPSRAIAGAQVQVSGANWAAARTVEIRWDGAGNQLLAQVSPATDGTFSRAVTIPSAATPGLFSIVAHQGDQHSGAVTVEVATASSAPDGSSPVQPTAPGSPSIGTSGGSNQSVPSQSAPVGSPSQVAPGQAVAPPGFVTAPNGSLTPADQPQASPSGQAAPAVPGAPTFATSGPQAATGAPREAAQPAQATPAEQAAASPKNPSRDLWSGFADGQNRSADDVVTLPSSAGANSMLPVGMAVLVGGLVSMVAGFGLAELRRRRVTA